MTRAGRSALSARTALPTGPLWLVVPLLVAVGAGIWAGMALFRLIAGI